MIMYRNQDPGLEKSACKTEHIEIKFSSQQTKVMCEESNTLYSSFYWIYF